MCNRFLRSRLAGRSGHRNQRLAPQLPHRGCQSLQGDQRVFDRQQPALPGIPVQLIVAYDGRDRTFVQRLLYEIMPIQPLALDRKEKLASRHRAGVDGIGLRHFFGQELSRRGNKLGDSGDRQLHLAAPAEAASHSNPAARRAPRATSRSSNGADPSRVTATFSCPLPANNTMSPGRASPMASAIALRRSTSTLYFTPAFCRPTTESLIMASGSSLRGLSEVNTTRSLPRPAASPIKGRFLRSRSPPHPNTVNTLPFALDTDSFANAVLFLRASSVRA